ncbi:hypothetical protein XaclCFBP3371_18650 [Xanthomonas euvesicatoria pv. citrumelonis]|nr:hypothetical protein CIW72_16995 [Xanthomonas citri pv. malvacearum]PPU87153.1 hypothetical protein XaclCFBP3371_18650 [Xanthomonas euvesicatoria pv. citrumelonis]RYF51663.1 MAG: hypothetical protein EOO38_02650 [Cytophagaceae bacterium]
MLEVGLAKFSRTTSTQGFDKHAVIVNELDGTTVCVDHQVLRLNVAMSNLLCFQIRGKSCKRLTKLG